jgi:hypothetical protein
MFPPGINRKVLAGFAAEVDGREAVLQAMIERFLGWDNARHYPDLANFPHHMHESDGRVELSELEGNPERDLERVRRRIEEFFAETVE